MTRVPGSLLDRRFLLGGAVAVWVLFAASFFMPVVRSMDLPGWEAFGMYLGEQLNVPEYWRKIQQSPASAFSCTFLFTNSLMLIAPVLLWGWPRWAGWLGLFLMLGGIVPVVAFNQMVKTNELRFGYYCWVGSIFLMAGVCFCDSRRHRRKAPRL
jgi:hypothetical protein